MSERLKNRLSIAVTLLLAAFVAVSLATADPPERDRAEEIGSLVRCPVCNGESIADSPATLARDMMAVVREGIDAGLSDEQIIDGLLASYSDAQRLDPRVRPSTIALWLVPGAALAVGLVLVGNAVRERRTPAAEVPEPAGRR